VARWVRDLILLEVPVSILTLGIEFAVQTASDPWSNESWPSRYNKVVFSLPSI
jgi:hypothetical protein